MSRELWGRVWEIQVDGESFGAVSTRATARYPAGQPSTIDLEVYHPDPALVSLARDKTTRWRVLAGYESDGGAQEIGQGTPIPGSVTYRRDLDDMPLALQLSSRAAATRIILSRSWASIRASEVLDAIAEDLGLSLAYTPGDRDPLYSRGYVAQGTAATVLDPLARDLGATWQIDGVTLRAWPIGDAQVTTADVWAADTGLLEAPETDGETGQILAAARLRPAIRQGHAVYLDDEGYTGAVITLDAQHEIDTDGDAWLTSIRGRPR